VAQDGDFRRWITGPSSLRSPGATLPPPAPPPPEPVPQKTEEPLPPPSKVPPVPKQDEAAPPAGAEQGPDNGDYLPEPKQPPDAGS
jgi:hypothetical protein